MHEGFFHVLINTMNNMKCFSLQMWKLSQKAEIQKAGLGSNKAPNSITHYMRCGPSGEFPAQNVNEINFIYNKLTALHIRTSAHCINQM